MIFKTLVFFACCSLLRLKQTNRTPNQPTTPSLSMTVPNDAVSKQADDRPAESELVRGTEAELIELGDATELNESGLSRGKVRGPWSPEEDAVLSRLVSKFGARNWSLIARGIPGRSGKSCRLRWCNQLDPCVKRKPFSGNLITATATIIALSFALYAYLYLCLEYWFGFCCSLFVDFVCI